MNNNWPRTYELEREISLGCFASQEQRLSAIKRLAEVSFKDGVFYIALNSYFELNDTGMIRQVGEACLSYGHFHDANRAFEYLGDREGMFRVIKGTEAQNNSFTLDTALRSYLGRGNINEVNLRFQEWAKSHGIQGAYSLHTAKSANLAHILADNYDVGIGIARGGLFTSYIFNKFGLDTKIVQAHRRGKGATFKWVSEISKDEIKGKRVAVFDKDVVSGRTVRRVYREIKLLGPKTIDLVLDNDPCGPCGIGTNLANVPEGFDNVFYPKSFSYSSFDKAVEILEGGL